MKGKRDSNEEIIRPFPLSMFSLHLLTRKLERCPYCGKWSFVRRASRAELEAAARAELQGETQTVHELTPEERLKQQIEDSRLSR